MSNQPKPVVIIAQNDLDKQSQADLLVSTLTLAGRLKRGLKVLGISWSIAIFCIFIPVLHFFLVPMGLLIGPILLYRQLTFHELLIGGMIVCPKCNHEFQSTKEAFNWPKRETCPSCNTVLILKLLPI